MRFRGSPGRSFRFRTTARKGGSDARQAAAALLKGSRSGPERDTGCADARGRNESARLRRAAAPGAVRPGEAAIDATAQRA